LSPRFARVLRKRGALPIGVQAGLERARNAFVFGADGLGQGHRVLALDEERALLAVIEARVLPARERVLRLHHRDLVGALLLGDDDRARVLRQAAGDVADRLPLRGVRGRGAGARRERGLARLAPHARQGGR
jgi:hypothetical protein